MECKQLVAQVISMINSECELFGFLQKHPMCIRDEFISETEEREYEAVKLKHDEDFCRVRELLREITGDKTLFAC